MKNIATITNPTELIDTLSKDRELTPQQRREIQRAWFAKLVQDFELPTKQ